jgi:hypothetical protein
MIVLMILTVRYASIQDYDQDQDRSRNSFPGRLTLSAAILAYAV